MEKCYREIQNQGRVAGVNVVELFILLAVPLILFPIFTLLNFHSLIVFGIELLLYIMFRLADRVSSFEYGLASFVYARFVWPKQLSAYVLEEARYLKDRERAGGEISTNHRE